MRTLALAGLAAFACAAPAAAHIALAETQTSAGGYYVASFRVGHGCEGVATTAVRVELPAGVSSAKPQPKTGWTVLIERDRASGPGEGRPNAVTWRGRLGDDEFDEFRMMVRLPNQAGPLYFPTVQSCVGGEVRWTEIPAPGAAWTSVPHPAPVVNLTAATPAQAEAAPAAAHQH